MSQPHYAEYVPSFALRERLVNGFVSGEPDARFRERPRLINKIDHRINLEDPETERIFTPEPLPPNIPAGPGAKRLLDLGAGDCRFPVGDEDGHLQLFCGEPQDGRSSYCAACGRRSHQTRKLSKITVPN